MEPNPTYFCFAPPAEKAEEEELGEIGKPRESEHECAYDGLSFKGPLAYDVHMNFEFLSIVNLQLLWT